MKLSNIFKKEVKATSAKVEKLGNKQLGTIIGGTDSSTEPTQALIVPVSGKGIQENGIH
jgi:hypothetical protein